MTRNWMYKHKVRVLLFIVMMGILVIQALRTSWLFVVPPPTSSSSSASLQWLLPPSSSSSTLETAKDSLNLFVQQQEQDEDVLQSKNSLMIHRLPIPGDHDVVDDDKNKQNSWQSSSSPLLESSFYNDKNNNNKPWIILHLGPAKTGTSTLQNEMTAWQQAAQFMPSSSSSSSTTTTTSTNTTNNITNDPFFYYAGAWAPQGGRAVVQALLLDTSCHVQMANERVYWQSQQQQQQQPTNQSSIHYSSLLRKHLEQNVPCFRRLMEKLSLFHANATSLIVSNEVKSLADKWWNVPVVSNNNMQNNQQQQQRKQPSPPPQQFDYPHKVPLDWKTLTGTLQHEWNFLLVLGHRPYLDWLQSAKTQVGKYSPLKRLLNIWPSQGGKRFQSLFPSRMLVHPNQTLQDLPKALERLVDSPSWEAVAAATNFTASILSQRDRQELIRHWNVQSGNFLSTSDIYERSASYIPVKLLHLYHDEGVRTHFLCDILPRASRSCEASRALPHMGRLGEGSAHAARTWYDQLACAAQKAGLVPSSVSRSRLVSKIQTMHESTRNRTIRDLPRKCPNPVALMALWERSWELEVQLLGPALANLTLHRELFRKHLQEGTYCTLDAEQTLTMNEWQHFFAEFHSNTD